MEIIMTLMHLVIQILIQITNFVGYVLELFGYKVYKVTLERILEGASPELLDVVKEPDIADSLAIIADGMREDQQAHLVGRVWLVNEYRSILQARADVITALNNNPDIMQTEIRRPLVLVGAPRTGTTLLHSLLAQDPQFFAPMTWEVLRPVPPGRPDNWRNCQRYLKCKQEMDMYHMVAPNVKKVHDIQADTPEECYVLMKQSLNRYEDFLRLKALHRRADLHYSLPHEDLVRIYRFFKKQLQCIAYKSLGSRRYLLKSHIHLRGLDALLEVFPDACLVYTHRPLTQVIPSFAAMIEAMDPFATRDNEYGKRALRLISTYLNRAVKVMKTYDEKERSPFINIKYEALTQNPFKEIQKIYDYFGYELSERTKHNMMQYLNRNPQHKHGRYAYSLEEFGLTESDITNSCQPYIDLIEELGWQAV